MSFGKKLPWHNQGFQVLLRMSDYSQRKVYRTFDIIVLENIISNYLWMVLLKNMASKRGTYLGNTRVTSSIIGRQKKVPTF